MDKKTNPGKKQEKKTKYYRNAAKYKNTEIAVSTAQKNRSLLERLKDHFKSEREKLQDYSMKKKLEYILEYYWLWILGIVLAITIPSYMIYRAVSARKENWFFIVYANTFEDVGNHSDLWNDFVDYAGYDLKEKNVEFNNNCFFDPTSVSGTNNSYYQSFVVYVDSGKLDAVTMEQEHIEALGKSGRLLDLEDEKCAKLLEKYKERLVYTVPYDEEYEKELVAIGIDVSDSILMTKYHIYPDNCILGISANTDHLEEVERFLNFILEE